MPAPTELWQRVMDRTRAAMAAGALERIETEATIVEDGGISFVVRVAATLGRKPRPGVASATASASPPHANPFLPYDRTLWVATLSPTHVCLLNKYNVVDHHLLVVTREYEDQRTLLTRADFDALSRCLEAADDALGFYNGGTEAGASQPHKHLQMVPLPISPVSISVPIEPLIRAAEGGRLPGLAVRHAFVSWITQKGQASVGADLLHHHYRELAHRVGVARRDSAEHDLQAIPYNLLVTRRWMLIVPRSAECCAGISINALGFAGSLFVRNRAQLDTVKSLGPMTMLRAVGLPMP